MTNTKAQKQKNYIECLNTRDRAAYLESERKQKKLVQLKKDETAYNLHLQKKQKKERKSVTNKIEEKYK